MIMMILTMIMMILTMIMKKEMDMKMNITAIPMIPIKMITMDKIRINHIKEMVIMNIILKMLNNKISLMIKMDIVTLVIFPMKV